MHFNVKITSRVKNGFKLRGDTFILDELECPIGYRLGDKLATSERHNM